MPETDAFVKKVTSEIRDMERREEKLKRDAEAIRLSLGEMRQRRVELDRSLAVYREVMGVGEAVASPEVPEGTIADVALKILRDMGRPATVGYLVAELQALGKLKGGGASGRADYGTVYQALNRDPRFLRVGKGEFSPAPEGPSVPERPI
jgi:hypothetical protein